MKRVSKHPGGQRKTTRPSNRRARSDTRKIFDQKKRSNDQRGVSEDGLIELGRQNEVDVREAAVEELAAIELCFDLAGKFACEFAKKTGDAIATVRDRYETIAQEFRIVRGGPHSLGTLLRGRYETEAALNEFLPKFAEWIGKYVSDCIHEHTFTFAPTYRQIVPAHTWTLSGHSVSRELLTALAREYVRDREGLLKFLCAVFRRWRKIDQSSSAWRVKAVIEQHANSVPHHQIAQRLQKVDAIPKGTVVPGTNAYRKLRSKIKKIRSRGRKAALQRRAGDKSG